ncbi:hypothetical protein AB7849_15670 [Rhodanobacter sp. 115]|uniref:hypothetical protein n=1 Tax=Rhodanobacter sp. FW021-MT20 TaxID=1162282 RepID=UPI0034E42FF9
MGPYNNETRTYEKVEGYESGHWYVKESTRELFIVPSAEAEIEGPDNETLEALNTIYREKPFKEVDAYAVANQLGLVVVADALKRFDTEVGYFHA